MKIMKIIFVLVFLGVAILALTQPKSEPLCRKHSIEDVFTGCGGAR